MRQYYTPLRYPGGKAKLSWLVKEILSSNSLKGGHYIEPYAGGAGVAFELLLGEHVNRIHINDLNAGVYSFWRAVLDFTDDLCKKILETPVDMDTWWAQKRVMQSVTENSIVDVAFSFFFLNRTNRSGIISGGVIGGYDQTGPYKIDARYDKKALVDRIVRIASYKHRVCLYNLDAEEFLQVVDDSLGERSLVYIDPPYFVQGKRLYDNFYNTEDHKRIACLIEKLKLPWMLSYDDHPAIRDLYKNFRNVPIELIYSAAKYGKGTERLIFADRIKLPESLDCAA